MIGLLVLVVIVVVIASYVWFVRQREGTGLGTPKAAASERGPLDRWVEAGLITPEQGEAITAFESREAGPPRRISLVAEALGYVGAVLALAGGGSALGQVWEDLDLWARPVILGGAAVALLIGGWLIRREQEPALRRLSGVLWFLSAGAVAAATALIFVDLVQGSDELAVFGTGAAATLYGGALWFLQRRALQQVAVLSGLIVTLVGGLLLLPGETSSWVFALAVWGLGAIWALLGLGRIVEPSWAAVPLGALAALIAPSVAVDEFGWMYLVALGTAGALIAASVFLGQTWLLGPGAVGMFVFVTSAIVKYFGETVGVPVALALAGAAVLVLALVVARARRFTGGPRGPRGPLGQAA